MRNPETATHSPLQSSRLARSWWQPIFHIDMKLMLGYFNRALGKSSVDSFQRLLAIPWLFPGYRSRYTAWLHDLSHHMSTNSWWDIFIFLFTCWYSRYPHIYSSWLYIAVTISVVLTLWRSELTRKMSEEVQAGEGAESIPAQNTSENASLPLPPAHSQAGATTG